MIVGTPDGYGVYGRLTDTPEGLICHECGQPTHQLATHCYYRHHMDADTYRTRHGLPQGARLASRTARGRMRQRWQAHRDAHMARLEATRDPRRATRASIPTSRRRADGARASQREYLASRAGRPLTAEERQALSEAEGTAAWCATAWHILRDPTVSQTSLARSIGEKPGTIHARLRRYPPPWGLPGAGNHQK